MVKETKDGRRTRVWPSTMEPQHRFSATSERISQWITEQVIKVQFYKTWKVRKLESKHVILKNSEIKIILTQYERSLGNLKKKYCECFNFWIIIEWLLYKLSCWKIYLIFTTLGNEYTKIFNIDIYNLNYMQQ